MTAEALAAIVSAALGAGGALSAVGMWTWRLAARLQSSEARANSLANQLRRLEAEHARFQTINICDLRHGVNADAIQEIKAELREGREEMRRTATSIQKLAAAISNGVTLDDRS